MKKTLIITYNMIPNATSWGSCQRMYFLADYLLAKGIDVHIIHAINQYSGNCGHEIKFSSTPINLDFLKYDNKQKIKKEDGYLSQNKDIAFFFKRMASTYFKVIEKKFFNDVNPFIGFWGYIFTLIAKEKIKNLINASKIDFIIISGPPFSIFSLIYFIKKKFPLIPVILDYRDPWNIYNPLLISEYVERKMLQKADLVIFYNEKMLKDMSNKYIFLKSKSSFVLNGYSEKDWHEVGLLEKNMGSLEKKLIISYIGSAGLGKSEFRDFSEFWAAFLDFYPGKKILLRFIGIKKSNQTEQLLTKFPGCIEIIPPVSHQKSLEYMIKSDVLLHLHTDIKSGRSVIAGKFYDYIKSGKVIFGISGDRQSYFLDLMDEHQIGVSCLNKRDEILDCLELLYAKWTTEKMDELRQDKGINIDSYSREFQNRRYLEIIKKKIS
ncbi:MAG: glycosyltransferase family protein [Methanoregula sp.]